MNYLLILTIFPIFYLCKYISDKDINKEPKKLVRRIFIMSIFSVVPIIFLEIELMKYFPADDASLDFTNLFINIFISIALVEEGFKYIIAMINCYFNKEFDEFYDGIVYGVYASLGFALVENILYVFNNFDAAYSTAILRAIISIPGHACFGIVIGYFIAKAKFSNKNKSINLILGLLVPAILHTIYDSLLFYSSDLCVILFFLFYIIMFIYCFILVKKVSRNQYHE